MGNNPVYQCRTCLRLITPDVWCSECRQCAYDCRCGEVAVRQELEENNEYRR